MNNDKLLKDVRELMDNYENDPIGTTESLGEIVSVHYKTFELALRFMEKMLSEPSDYAQYWVDIDNYKLHLDPEESRQAYVKYTLQELENEYECVNSTENGIKECIKNLEDYKKRYHSYGTPNIHYAIGIEASINIISKLLKENEDE